MSLERAPILAIIDEPEYDDPTHSGNVRVVARSEAVNMLGEFFERAEMFSKPEKLRLIESIICIYINAASVVKQGRAQHTKNVICISH
jgi:hypothetical protein